MCKVSLWSTARSGRLVSATPGTRHQCVWLTGPRRVGKTVLARQFPAATFLNCDLPSVADRLADPEGFYRALSTPLVVFDEVHQLPDPQPAVEIGADEFRPLRILATGLSTLAATRKFRDSLAGRKRVVRLVPVLYAELPAFGIRDLIERLRRGGLPSVLLGSDDPDTFFPEWLDSYPARDVQELFHLEKRAAFLRLLQFLARQSGGLLDVSKLAVAAEVSRPTVMNWLDIYEITHTVHVVRPYAQGDGARLSRSLVSTRSTPGWCATSADGTGFGRTIAAACGSISCSSRSSREACRVSTTGATSSIARWTSSCRSAAASTPSNVSGARPSSIPVAWARSGSGIRPGGTSWWRRSMGTLTNARLAVCVSLVVSPSSLPV